MDREVALSRAISSINEGKVRAVMV